MKTLGISVCPVVTNDWIEGSTGICVCICMCVCVCAYIYACIHTYTYIHIYICVCRSNKQSFSPGKAALGLAKSEH